VESFLFVKIPEDSFKADYNDREFLSLCVKSIF
jgi:hypothetical protein